MLYNSKSLSRIRNNSVIRDLTSSVSLHASNFIQVLFVDETLLQIKPVQHMNGFWIDTPTTISDTIRSDLSVGISAFILFCVAKDKHNALSFSESIVRGIKKEFGDKVFLICDLCLCGETHDGHCGFMNANLNLIDNTKTVAKLAEHALRLAQSGADCIAPSDMQDGRVLAIRQKLNDNNFAHILIMSYSTKFSSNYYSAFRTIYNSGIAKNSPLQDRKTYQIDPRNPKDALLSSIRDEQEGADILMVKPIIRYLDIVRDIQSTCHLPLAGFHVSTEVVSINLLVSGGYGTMKDLLLEDWYAIKRAGVQMIITYTARLLKDFL